LVGVVSHVADRYCVVRILLNTDFRASAKVQRSRVDGILAWDGRSLGFPHDAECGLPAAVGDGSDGDLVQVWNESAGVVTAARKLGMRPEDLWRRAQTLRERGHVLALRTWTPRRRRGPARKPYAPKGMPALAQMWLGRVSDRALADSLDPPRASSTVRRWRMALRIPPWRGHAPAGMRIDLADGMGAP